jgi:hypothetical protein
MIIESWGLLRQAPFLRAPVFPPYDVLPLRARFFWPTPTGLDTLRRRNVLTGHRFAFTRQ